MSSHGEHSGYSQVTGSLCASCLTVDPTEDAQDDADLISHAGEIFSPVILPVSGRTVPNRLIKVC